MIHSSEVLPANEFRELFNGRTVVKGCGQKYRSFLSPRVVSVLMHTVFVFVNHEILMFIKIPFNRLILLVVEALLEGEKGQTQLYPTFHGLVFQMLGIPPLYSLSVFT